MKFTYQVTINVLPIDDDKKCVETMTGEIEASDHARAKQRVQSLAFARCRQLEQECGDIYGYENVQVKIKPALVSLEVMTPEAYQRAALRTLYPDLTFKDRLGLCGIGLPSELGEALDYVKKFLYHRNGKPLAVDEIKDELGDMLWYFFILLDTLGITFEEVMAASAAKLNTRHPNGFNPHYSSDSHASEVSR